jgi:hypothetical protein
MVSAYWECSKRKLRKAGLSSKTRSATTPRRETTAGLLVARRRLCTPSIPSRNVTWPLVAAISACREATPGAVRSGQRPLEATTRRRGRRILTHRVFAPSPRASQSITSTRASASAFAQPRGNKAEPAAIACWWSFKGEEYMVRTGAIHR